MSLPNYSIYYSVCVPNGFLGHNYVCLDTKNMSLVHIVPKMKAFEESVSHFE